jgi:hypothetical protein
MIRRIVIFLIRKKFGLKAYECFQFNNQSNDAVYYFTDIELKKRRSSSKVYISGCSINWLLDESCAIKKLGYDATWE